MCFYRRRTLIVLFQSSHPLSLLQFIYFTINLTSLKEGATSENAGKTQVLIWPLDLLWAYFPF